MLKYKKLSKKISIFFFFFYNGGQRLGKCTLLFLKKKKKKTKKANWKREKNIVVEIIEFKKKKKTIVVEGKNLGAPPLTWGVGPMVGALFLKHVRITCCGDLREMEKRELFF